MFGRLHSQISSCDNNDVGDGVNVTPNKGDKTVQIVDPKVLGQNSSPKFNKCQCSQFFELSLLVHLKLNNEIYLGDYFANDSETKWLVLDGIV